MDKKRIKFSFTAPYYQLGTISDKTEFIWLAFHGYAQLAKDFAKRFDAVDLEKNVLIFPQGLSKFYLKGVSDKIGANWMTSHDRELDITNYLSYISEIYIHEIQSHLHHLKLGVFGFSQGGHTASRWITHAKVSYEKLMLWGSSLANEINAEDVKESFSNGDNYLVIGNNDRFIKSEQLAIEKVRYDQLNFNYHLVEYHGGHEIYPDVLRTLIL